MAIKIIADSTSDIDTEEAKELGITIIPMTVTFGEEEFLDGEELSHEEFFEKIQTNPNHPRTSQISPYQFEEAFKKIVDDGDEAIVITLSSKLSGTYQNAVGCAEKYADKIKVVDSVNASLGEKVLCLHALDLVKEGKTLLQIEEELNSSKTKIEHYAIMDNLKFLQKGGRISALTAFFASSLHIKPIISLKGGVVSIVSKALGMKKAYSLLKGIVEKVGGIDFKRPFTTAFSGLDKSIVEKFISACASLFENCKKIPSYCIGPTMGCHIGPGAVGIAFFSKE